MKKKYLMMLALCMPIVAMGINPYSDETDSEGFKFIDSFVYVKDICGSNTNSYQYSFLTNCNQNESFSDRIKANVFSVENFYGLNEGQSYAHFCVYGDKDLTNKLGEFNFCWGWYSMTIGDDLFSFSDAYENMTVNGTKDLTSNDGTTYTIELLAKNTSNNTITFSVNHPLYFGGDDNGAVGVQNFRNRVQIKYLKDITQDEEQPQQDVLAPTKALTPSYSQEIDNYGSGSFYLPGNKTAFEGQMVCGIEQTALTWSGYRYYSTFKYSLIPLEKSDMVSFVYSNENIEVGATIDGKKIIAKSKYFNLPYAPGAYTAASQTDVFYFFTEDGSVAVVEDYHDTPYPGQTSTYSWDPEEHRPESSYSYCYAVILEEDNNEISHYEYVDLGLPSGIKWANMNVGAMSVEDAGLKYAWGETTTKEEFSDANYKFGTSIYDISKYNETDGLTILLPEDDAATVNMGAEWRTPTVEEWYELTNNCTRQWTKSNGVYGYRFIGTNGNSIFIPVWIETSWMGGAGAYWTSTLGDADYAAYDIDFDGGGFYIDCSHSIDAGHRSTGRNVRAVYDPRVETLKCGTPTIAYSEGKLMFECETEDVEFVSEVNSCTGVQAGNQAEMTLETPVTTITVYAKKSGYENSDVVTATISWCDGHPVFEGFSSVELETDKLKGDVNGDGQVGIGDIVAITNIMAGQESVD